MIRVLTGVEAKAVLEDMMADICAHADDVFDGTAARFALVVWPEGFEAEADAIAVFAQPEAQPVAVTALRTAAEALATTPGKPSSASEGVGT